MRSIFVAVLAAASALLGGAAFADHNTAVRRPLVTAAPTPVAEAVLVVAETK